MEHQSNQRLMETFVQAPLTVVLADNVVIEDHAQGRVFQGRHDATIVLEAFFATGFPDAMLKIRHVVDHQNIGVLEAVFCGHQNGPFLGIPATRREVYLPMVLVCRFGEAELQHIAWYYDAGALLRQLGLALVM